MRHDDIIKHITIDRLTATSVSECLLMKHLLKHREIHREPGFYLEFKRFVYKDHKCDTCGKVCEHINKESVDISRLPREYRELWKGGLRLWLCKNCAKEFEFECDFVMYISEKDFLELKICF